VARALDRNLASRYKTAVELLADLTAFREAATKTQAKGIDVLRLLRRPVVAVPALAALIAVGVLATTALRRNAQMRWAREEAIPKIMHLVEIDDAARAFVLAKEAERYLPNDPVLAGLWPQFSVTGALASTPQGADVFVQPYRAGSDPWERLGRTPITNLKLPRGVFRFRIEKEGFEPRLLAARNPGSLLGNQATVSGSVAGRTPRPVEIVLVEKGAASPEMLPVAGGAFPVGLTGFNSDQPVELTSFLIDRYEVSNKDFKRFVDGKGYEAAGHWSDLKFVKDGRQVDWREAVSGFVDSTDRPGPSNWELGEYSAGEADYPVTGVSWYEAVAYCRATGKTLPTIFHWARAALSPAEIGSPLAPAIIPLSNFAGKGLAAVGSYHGLGPYGTYDMAGNAREWVWNEAADGRRWILGGMWNDPDYMFTVPNNLPPFDRSATNGFRCARYAKPTDAPPPLLARVDTYSRDNRSAKAVSNEIYEVFKRQYSYAKSPLNDRVEARDTTAADWVREAISFDAGYETGRVMAYLFLPKNVPPPYQLIVLFPGVGPFAGRGSSTNIQPGGSDFIVKSGRAFVFPVFKGSFERWDPFVSLQGEEYLRTFRTRMFQWRQDLARVIDVLGARKDIDVNRVAYYGASFGASTAFPLVALEERLKTAILGPAGFTYRQMPPEADALNYVSHVTMPVLMLGGRHDYIFPLETAQKPMFERLGTPDKDKKHVVFDAGHGNFPRSEMIREVLAWLDRYLGRVGSTDAARH
jgi:formylglycine-generating enzyme required for sulfatase activity/dienelactone hydrolase